ncbi:hypothetical protein BDR06DRAFT_967978 [Suillus hirtellus]|nr:hypothetical protein BDR06DRAFT_967978 [Suillus hirtellus]
MCNSCKKNVSQRSEANNWIGVQYFTTPDPYNTFQMESGQQVHKLQMVLHVTSTVISGSYVRNMLLAQNTVTDNMSIIVPNSESITFVLYAFIIEDLQYEHVIDNAYINHSYDGVVESFTKFHHNNLFITITESKIHGIFRVITAAPTTADMVFMTGGGIAALYPTWTLNGIVMLNHTISSAGSDQNIGCIKQTQWRIKADTNFMQEACIDLCPTIWWNIADSDE